MKIKLLTIVVSSALVSGCFSTTIKNPDQYKTVPMEKASIYPTKIQLENRPYKVVVFNLDDKGVRLAKQANVGVGISREISKHINKSNAGTVDRSLFMELKNSLDAHKENYKNSTQVDYAVIGQVTVAKYTSTYSKATSSKDKNGKVYVTEPSCRYGALVQGSVSIYDVTTMRLAHSFAISGGAGKSESVARNRSCRHLSQTEIIGHVKAAGLKAAKREDVQLKNFFRPKGYVLERRTNGDENIFRISIGKSSGVVADQDAVFYTINEDKQPAAGKPSQTQNKMGGGTVSDKVSAKESWIVVKDKKVASKIKLGDIVKVVYAKGFWNSIFNRSFSN